MKSGKKKKSYGKNNNHKSINVYKKKLYTQKNYRKKKTKLLKSFKVVKGD